MEQMSAAVSSTATAADERLTALRAFDDTKTGVKGLVEAGVTTVPSIFLFPPVRCLPRPPHFSIPTIDLSLSDDITLPSLISAARHWGFFQLTNHSIPLPVLRRALSAVRSFHSLPPATRSSHYNRSDPSVRYFSNIDLFRSPAASWRDTLEVINCAAVAERIPEVCREQLVEWDAAATAAARKVAWMLGEGMGMGADRFEKMGAFEQKVVVCHCYPPCPEPEKAMGVMEHRDPAFLTVLVQDEVGGLQVRKVGEDWWVDVKPIPGSIIVNIGDLFQIISNDEFKSATHRVVANSTKDDRISIAMFFNPLSKADSEVYGPMPELLSSEKPALFCNFTMPEFIGAFLSVELGCSLVDRFRTNSS